MQFDLIAAVDSSFGIGRTADPMLPWARTPAGREDMSWFVYKTGASDTDARCIVIMGRRTWETLRKPLTNRINMVISAREVGITVTGAAGPSPCIFVGSFTAALAESERMIAAGEYVATQCMVIGGRSVYEQALQHPMLRHGYITVLPACYDCDVYFPDLHDAKYTVGAGDGRHNEYRKYDFVGSAESRYMSLVSRVMTQPARPNRTDVPTRSAFAKSLKFPLRDCRGPIIPLLTCKRVPWKCVQRELIWFLRGDTNTQYLREHNVHIWDKNTTREFLDARGLADYAEGDVGPSYGYQWRARSDQLQRVIAELKRDPYSRRLVVSAWNVDDLPRMVLPPCHFAFQFYVHDSHCEQQTTRCLNCAVSMRSADLALGVPFNIASYAMLTHIVARIVGMTAHRICVYMTDCHVYESHLAGCSDMIARVPWRFPRLEFAPHIGAGPTLDDFVVDPLPLVVCDYMPHPAIQLDMAI